MDRRELLKNVVGASALAALPMSASFAFGDDRTRTTTLQAALTQLTHKDYSAITDADLAAVTTMDLPHIHIKTFLDLDFQGLPNLKDLTVRSIFHSWPGLPETVFAQLPGLEKLTFDYNQFPALPANVFDPLQSLKTLVLLDVTFDALPESIFRLPGIEQIQVQSLDVDQLNQLKNAYGSKVVEI